MVQVLSLAAALTCMRSRAKGKGSSTTCVDSRCGAGQQMRSLNSGPTAVAEVDEKEQARPDLPKLQYVHSSDRIAVSHLSTGRASDRLIIRANVNRQTNSTG